MRKEINLNEYKVHVIDDESFRFYIEHLPSGRVSYHAGYQQIAMLDDVAAMSGYYSGSSDKEFVPLLAEDALREFAVCENKGLELNVDVFVIA